MTPAEQEELHTFTGHGVMRGHPKDHWRSTVQARDVAHAKEQFLEDDPKRVVAHVALRPDPEPAP